MFGAAGWGNQRTEDFFGETFYNWLKKGETTTPKHALSLSQKWGAEAGTQEVHVLDFLLTQQRSSHVSKSLRWKFYFM